MSTTIIIILVALGLIMPLFWIIGAMTSLGYVAIFKGMGIFAKNWEGREKIKATAFKGQLGVTMADGGVSIEEEETTKRSYGKKGLYYGRVYLR